MRMTQDPFRKQTRHKKSYKKEILKRIKNIQDTDSDEDAKTISTANDQHFLECDAIGKMNTLLAKGTDKIEKRYGVPLTKEQFRENKIYFCAPQ
jgi:hypothetical protein